MNLLDQLQQLSPAPRDPASPDQTSTGSTDQGGAAVCSRKACRLPAEWQLVWNNPKIHTPDRRKTWVACGDHRDWLEDYLQARGLWRQTLPLVGDVPGVHTGTGETGDTD